jgi:hypothetical protein
MIDFATARQRAEAVIDREFGSRTDEEIIILDQDILQTDDVWIFPYTTRTYHETGDEDHILFGNSPIVVPKNGAPPWSPFAGIPFDEQIKGYSQARPVSL